MILIGIFFWGFHGYVRAQIAPANSIEIQVTGEEVGMAVRISGRDAHAESISTCR